MVIVHHVDDQRKMKSLQGLFLWEVNKETRESSLQLEVRGTGRQTRRQPSALARGIAVLSPGRPQSLTVSSPQKETLIHA